MATTMMTNEAEMTYRSLIRFRTTTKRATFASSSKNSDHAGTFTGKRVPTIVLSPTNGSAEWLGYVTKNAPKRIHNIMLIRSTPKSTRFGDDFVVPLAPWILAGLSPLHFARSHEPPSTPSYFAATAS